MFNVFMIPVIFGLGLLVAHFFYKKELFQEQMKRIELEQRMIQMELYLDQLEKNKERDQ